MNAPSRGPWALRLAPIVCGIVLASVAATALAIPADVLRGALQRWEFWGLEVLFVAFVATSAIELRHLHAGPRVAAWAVGLGLATMVANGLVAPRTNRIYYDEHIYQGVAQNLTDLHQAQMCNDGTLDYGRLQCWRAEFNKEPNGYPHLLSVVYRVFGVSEQAAFVVNNVVGGLTTSVVVLLGWLLAADVRVASLSGAVLALLPMQLWWSNTAAAEPLAGLVTAASVLAAVHFGSVGSPGALAWVVASTAFATTVRPESVLVVPLVVITLALLSPQVFRRPVTWWAAAAGAGLCALSLWHLAAVRHENWGATQARFGWEYVRVNLPANTWFYLGSDDRFPPLMAVAALAGLLSWQQKRQCLLLSSYFLMFWGVFVAFYAGSYYYGADVRYALLSHVPLAVLAGVGLTRLIDVLARFVDARWAAVAVSAGMVLQFSWYLPGVRSTGEEAWAARADVAYARRFVERLPPNAIVLTHNPSMFHLWGQSAAQLSLAVTDRGYVRDQLFRRYTGGVFLHWNFWCNVSDPVQTEFCRTALDAFPHEAIAEEAVRDYVYRLYRLRGP